jgi:chitin disaccharide deacetylase
MMMPIGRTNELLGYPADARLLIINADDFGMYPAINEAVVRAFKEGVVRSTTLMTPCPSASDAMRLLQENADITSGVHLSVICDIDTYRWGPVASPDLVPSLLEADGNFVALDRMSDWKTRAKLDELEIEFRAQIEKALSANLHPTHLDWHCLHAGGRPDIFDLTVSLAKEHGLALRVADPLLCDLLHDQGLPVAEHKLVDSFSLPTEGKSDRYLQMLKNLPAGLSEWAVHPGNDSPEAQTTDPNGWTVRNADYRFLVSQEARDTIEQEGIILLDYRALQALWNAA